MALHPEAQLAAQQEIDRVVGRGRLPGWSDAPELRYVRALIKELQCYAPLASIGVPHAATEDFIYRDFLFPKGTILIPNITVISHHASRYENPEIFDPTRFMCDDEILDIDPATSALRSGSDYKTRDHFMYGFRRRFCPGSNVAEDSLYITITRILWGFSIAALPGQRLDLEDQRKCSYWYYVLVAPVRNQALSLTHDLLARRSSEKSNPFMLRILPRPGLSSLLQGSGKGDEKDAHKAYQ